VKLRDVATGALKTTLIGHAHNVESVAFSQGGWTLVWMII